MVNALKDAVPFESLYSYVFIGRMGKALADYPAPYVERPSHDVSVPMKCDTAGRGYHFHIPVEVNGISIGYVKLAVADLMKVGEIVYHNPVFMVAPPDKEVDSMFGFDGVLGYNFIRDIKEIIIDNENGKFVFPYRISDGKPNMYLVSNTPNIRTEYEGQPYDMVFDSGNVKSDLGNKFAMMFPETLSGLEENASSRGGFGGLLLSGSLGADFILSFKRLTVNYENMFVRGE